MSCNKDYPNLNVTLLKIMNIVMSYFKVGFESQDLALMIKEKKHKGNLICLN
jgi:hypothetical protein